MLHALRPANWLDWLLLIYLALGVWQGLRRGLLLSVAALAASVLALVLALHYTTAAVAFANGHWHTETNLEHYLSRQMPLPDGSGQVPYTSASASVFTHELQQGPAGSSDAAMASLFTSGPPPSGPTTLQGYFDQILAQRIVSFGAFTALFVGGELVLNLLAGLIFGRIARRGVAGVLNGGLGGLFGAGERLVQAAVVLALVASASAVPAAHALAGPLDHSRWAPALIRTFRALLPGAQRWIGAWLA